MKKYDSVYSILLDILTAVQEGGSKISVIDDLLSEDAQAALSANQGRVLKGLIDGILTELTSTDNRLSAVEDEISGAIATVDQINGEII